MPARLLECWEVLYMGLSEYLDAVTDQIRCKRARPMIREELENHILEQAGAYEAEGRSSSDAREEAVRQMGDPVETGSALDRIHKPRLEWRLLLLVLLLSVAGLVVQYLASGNVSMMKFGYGDYFWKRQCVYLAIGLCIMFFVYLVDYTVLGRYPLLLWFGYFFLLVFLIVTGLVGNVAGKIRIFNYLTLFLPLYAGVIYHFRNKRYVGAGICLLLSGMPVLLGFKTILIHGSAELSVCCLSLLLVAVWKGYFGGKKGWTTVGLIAVPVLCLAVFFFWGRSTGWLAGYQRMRLQAIFRPDLRSEYVDNYFLKAVRDCVSGMQMFGPALTSIPKEMAPLNTNYIIFFVFARYGIAAGVLMTVLLAAAVIKAFMVSWKLKNRLGFLVGMACSMVLAIQVAIYIPANFGVPLFEPMTIPFLSYGGQSTIVNCILVGLVLGIYRNKDIVSEKDIKRGKWKIRLYRA